jgi:phosphatidylglycerol lysyltransferase
MLSRVRDLREQRVLAQDRDRRRRMLWAAAGGTGADDPGPPTTFNPVAMLRSERARAAAILSHYGRDPLDFFKLWPDKSYFLSPTSRCFIAYKAAWSVAISLGDPVGPDEELEPTVRAFLRFCDTAGWTAAFHQVGSKLVPMYRRLGFRTLKIGEGATVDLTHFRVNTIHRRAFRKIRRRFEGAAYALSRSVPPHAPRLLDEAEQVSDEWLSLPGRRERAFTVGRFDRAYLGQTPLFALRDPSGRLLAFVNEIPAYRPGTSTIDLMRHRRVIPNGTMDYLMASLLLELARSGCQRFSLGLAPFAGVGDKPGASLEERGARFLFEHLNHFFSYKGLRHYKAKFEPEWEDVFLAYQGGARGLVRTTVALNRITETLIRHPKQVPMWR